LYDSQLPIKKYTYATSKLNVRLPKKRNGATSKVVSVSAKLVIQLRYFNVRLSKNSVVLAAAFARLRKYPTTTTRGNVSST
jgi:hypothetical protein